MTRLIERPTGPDQIVLERHLGRVRELRERLYDEIYEAAVNGNDKRARYLEFCRDDMLPRVLADGDRRYREQARSRLKAARDAG